MLKIWKSEPHYASKRSKRKTSTNTLFLSQFLEYNTPLISKLPRIQDPFYIS